MSKVRYLNTRFWSDSWIVDELNPLDRYLFLYLLSNERTTISGIYELPIRTIANETGIEKEEVTRMMKRLEPKVYFRSGWVVLTNAIRHQNYKSPKIQAGIQRELCDVPAELIELLLTPADFNMDFSCPIDKNGYGMDRVSYTKPNLTKPNLTKPMVNTKAPKVAVAKATKLPSKDINELFDYWKEVTGYGIGGQVKQNRFACSNLIKKYELAGVKKLIQLVNMAQQDTYAGKAGKISNFVELQSNLTQLNVWMKTKATEQNKSTGVKI